MNRANRVADALNPYFHNWIVARMFAGWLILNWEEVKHAVEAETQVEA